MEPSSLHPFSEDTVREYLESGDLDAIACETNAEQNALTAGLGQWLAQRQPVFAANGLSLTGWEARIDRGISMMMRPPARLFHDAGLNLRASRRLPIRLDLAGPVMGGAFIPARLMAQADAQLDKRLEVTVRRMAEAEMDAVWLQSMIMEAVRYARSQNLGLFELSGLIDARHPETWPEDSKVITGPSDSEIVARSNAVLNPPKEPGRIRRLFMRTETT